MSFQGSDPRGMGLVNHMGAGLFDGYSKPAPTKNASRIRAIRDALDMVTDRHTGEVRTIRLSESAVLVALNKAAADYAKTLTEFGIPVRISGDGWTASPAIDAACLRWLWSPIRSTATPHFAC